MVMDMVKDVVVMDMMVVDVVMVVVILTLIESSKQKCCHLISIRRSYHSIHN